MATLAPTYVGQVASVTGAVVRVRLREDMPTTLVMIDGASYRVGQVGAYFRLPLGYTNLFAVCTQVGADAAPPGHAPTDDSSLDSQSRQRLSGFRWMTIVLFGESIGRAFERGVGQYPTIGDEVHLVTNDDLRIIYGWASERKGTVAVGHVASASGIAANVNIAGLVTRHTAVVGSTGSGKSNLVAVLLEAVSDGTLPTARCIVIDPHGEYATAAGEKARVFRLRPNAAAGELPLWVPFWALPFSELQDVTLGGLQPNHEASIRDEVLDRKIAATTHLDVAPPIESLTADSPVPFSLKQLWYDLDRNERITFSAASGQDETNAYNPIEPGDPSTLKADRYPPASPYNKAPYRNQRKRSIERQLELMRSRMKDSRYAFLFSPGDGYEPSTEGAVDSDLDELVRAWVGHDRPISVFDVSGIPSEIQPTVVGTMLRVVYEMLFWAQELPIGGREQPLLIVIDEAHRFIPDGGSSAAHRTLAMIAKEGRKYGAGLMLVTQRPSEIDAGILSQCGSMIALRMSNGSDRARIAAVVPDDLGGLIEQLPALRTGEAVFLGEVMPIPSRVRVRRALRKPLGTDPALPDAWQQPERPDGALYTTALTNWRSRTLEARSIENGGNQTAEGSGA